MKMSSRSTSRRLVLQTGVAAGVAAGLGLLAARTSPGIASESLPLIKKPIPSSQDMLPAVGLGTNNFDVGDPADIAARCCPWHRSATSAC